MAKNRNITTTQLALMTAAAVISLRGLPMMAQEELTMFFYIFFATFLFLIPAALVGAELGSAFASKGGGVYTWVKEAFNKHMGFTAIFLQWIQNVVWYPTVLGFAAASIAYMIGMPDLAQNGLFVGLFSIAMYWCATLVTLRGTSAISGITSKGFLIGTVLPGIVVIVMAVVWMIGGNSVALEHIPDTVSQVVNIDAAHHVHPRASCCCSPASRCTPCTPPNSKSRRRSFRAPCFSRRSSRSGFSRWARWPWRSSRPMTRSTSSRDCSPRSRSSSNTTRWAGSRTSWDCS